VQSPDFKHQYHKRANQNKKNNKKDQLYWHMAQVVEVLCDTHEFLNLNPSTNHKGKKEGKTKSAIEHD
jgi:hypothetical protein